MPDSVATTSRISLTVNGHQHELELDNRTTLLDALREHLDLTGTKKGCDHGQCGACTVLLDGRRANACLVFAVAAQNHAITTIEGVAGAQALHPMQQAFIEHDGFQCGYCTPGHRTARRRSSRRDLDRLGGTPSRRDCRDVASWAERASLDAYRRPVIR